MMLIVHSLITSKIVMNYFSKIILCFLVFSFVGLGHAGKIKPAGKMLVCALQENRAAFATDYFGNVVFCAQDTCRIIMERPGNALPEQIACMINNNVAYVVYSNHKLYRCTSDTYKLLKNNKSGCTIQVME